MEDQPTQCCLRCQAEHTLNWHHKCPKETNLEKNQRQWRLMCWTTGLMSLTRIKRLPAFLV